MFGPFRAGVIEDIASEMGTSTTFCYLIVAILALTAIFAILGWIAGKRRRRKEKLELNKKVCPACGGDNKPDALLCRFCEEML